MAERPAWVDPDEYPFEDRFLDVDGCRLHYVDEGPREAAPLLFVHGNPTWSFTWRVPVRELRATRRCVAIDLPGFGLSKPVREGYGFTPPEHARVLERFVAELDLRAITLVVQDWGGPIGFAAAGADPDRYAAFVVANTWAWPKSDPGTRAFSAFLGGPLGGYLIKRRNFFVEKIIPGAMQRRKPSDAAMNAYRGPFPSPESRVPVHVLPKAIIGCLDWLGGVERGIAQFAERPALIVWPTRDPALREPERRKWEDLFPNHHTVLLEGASHYIGEDAGEDVAEAIARFTLD